MRERIEKYSVSFWAQEFLDHLNQTSFDAKTQVRRRLVGGSRKRLLREYAVGEKRLLLLDYDGTLRPFTKTPEAAVPDAELMGILHRLSADPRNQVVIVSGRDREFLEGHLGSLPIGFVAGHGVWIRPAGEDWRPTLLHSVEWMKVIHPIMERFAVRTPGAFIEEKDFSLAWHYRRAEPDLSAVRIAELKDALYGFISSYQLSVLEGNRVLEVKPSDINKGSGVAAWLTGGDKDFILALGDDVTDEDLFQVLPRNGFTVKVGGGHSRANFSLENTTEVRNLLGELIAISEASERG
jgi:trehalose 6-phosphate synthase/phosphatase